MHDQTGGWAALGDGHLKRRTDQFGRHRRRHGPADDLAREEVHHRGQVQPAAARAQIGDVGHPGLVGTGGLELPVQHVARRGQAVPAVRRVDELALPRRSQPVGTHEAAHPVAPQLDPFASQRGLQTPTAIAPS